MRRRYCVALLIESSNAYARELLRGVSAFVRQRDVWTITLAENEPGFGPLTWFERWRGDGAIARIADSALARQLRTAPFPVVDVSGEHGDPGLANASTVLPDDAAISELAVAHLLERGFSQLAFCGDPRFRWSSKREAAFLDRARREGRQPFLYIPPKGDPAALSRSREARQLQRWLAALPKPVGVMASHDLRGQQLLSICRSERIMVPEQVAVLGVDNDSLICDFCDPPLSSVMPNAFQAGYDAAQLLHEMMTGKRTGPAHLLTSPSGVLARQSTDVIAVEDELVARALQLIRHHARDGITVAEIAQRLDVSRRTIDSRFLGCLGRTAHTEIERVRIERVKSLLNETSLPLKAIAEEAGFRHVEYLIVAFRRVVGTSPGRYRLQRERRQRTRR